MRGYDIICTKPKGFMDSGILSGTSLYPGMLLEIVPQTDISGGGKFTWRARSLAKGSKGPCAVLINDYDQGQTIFGWDSGVTGSTDSFGQPIHTWAAFQDGYFAPMIYWPIAGEELNLLLDSGPGTGTSGTYRVGDLLTFDTQGKLEANSSNTTAPFMLLEHITVALTGPYLVHVKYLGNQA